MRELLDSEPVQIFLFVIVIAVLVVLLIHGSISLLPTDFEEINSFMEECMETDKYSFDQCIQMLDR